MTNHSFSNLPENLPVPQDDGAANHLKEKTIPSITLYSTYDEYVNIAAIEGTFVLYFYPLSGRPGVNLPEGWNNIPGARGCTPQACSIRDHFEKLENLNVKVFGLSTQSTEYQKEFVARLHLPYPILSDMHLNLAEALQLPLFEAEAMQLYKRLTLIVQEGVIVKVFYPVFPPDENAEEVIQWLS